MQRTKRVIVMLLFLGFVLGLYAGLEFLNRRTNVRISHEGRLTVEDGTSLEMELVGGAWRVFEGCVSWDQIDWSGGELVDVMRIGSMEGHTFALEIQTSILEQARMMLPRPRGSSLYVNEKQITGQDGKAISSSDVLDLRNALDTDAPFTRIVLQVPISGYFYSGYQGFLLGNADTLANSYRLRWFVEVACLGLYIALGLICAILFFQKTSEGYIVWLALFVVLTAYRFISYSEHLSALLPVAQQSRVYRLFFFLRYCLCRVFVPADRRRVGDGLILILSAICAATFVFLPDAFVKVAAEINMYALVIEGVLIIRGFLMRRQGTLLLLGGWAVFIGMELFYRGLYTGFLAQGIIDVLLRPTQYAHLLYLLAFSGAILGKFACKFQEAEELAGTLEQKVNEQTQRLREQNASIIRMQQTRERFITDVVHNIRNPLFALGGYFELLEDSMEDAVPHQKQYLQKINQKLAYLNRLVADMLLIDRLENGRITFHVVTTALRPMLEAVLEENALVKCCPQVRLECEPITVEVDAFRMRQALDNIVDNAVIHGRCTELTLSAILEGENVCISVSDNGCGISEEQCAHAFDRYYTRGGQDSSGLGLAITKQIVQGHCGTIALHSEPGKGTTVKISLHKHMDLGDEEKIRSKLHTEARKLETE